MVEIRLRETGINDDRAVTTFSHSFEIVADDGRPLYTLTLREDGTLEVSSDTFTKHAGRLLSGQLCVRPWVTNVVRISRDEYSPDK